MKMKAYCEECGKDVGVKEIYFAGFHCNVYLKCGHHIHFVFAERSTKEHHDITMKGFIKVHEDSPP